MIVIIGQKRNIIHQSGLVCMYSADVHGDGKSTNMVLAKQLDYYM